MLNILTKWHIPEHPGAGWGNKNYDKIDFIFNSGWFTMGTLYPS